MGAGGAVQAGAAGPRAPDPGPRGAGARVGSPPGGSAAHAGRRAPACLPRGAVALPRPCAGRAGLRLRCGGSGSGSPVRGGGRLSSPRRPAARSPWQVGRTKPRALARTKFTAAGRSGLGQAACWAAPLAQTVGGAHTKSRVICISSCSQRGSRHTPVFAAALTPAVAASLTPVLLPVFTPWLAAHAALAASIVMCNF